MGREDARDDYRLRVARYQVDRLAREAGESGAEAGGADPATEREGRGADPGPARDPDGRTGQSDDQPDNAGQATMEQRAQYVEIAIGQAIRRGDFDNLPGAGKPLELQTTYDPDWWIRRKIEREKLTGLGPPALTLRTENAQLDARLDATSSERAVRELLEDFNRRVIDARRQLQGGPPVVTPTRNLDEEVARWHDRRASRQRAAEQAREREATARAAMSWRERRRARRGR